MIRIRLSGRDMELRRARSHKQPGVPRPRPESRRLTPRPDGNAVGARDARGCHGRIARQRPRAEILRRTCAAAQHRDARLARVRACASAAGRDWFHSRRARCGGGSRSARSRAFRPPRSNPTSRRPATTCRSRTRSRRSEGDERKPDLRLLHTPTRLTPPRPRRCGTARCRQTYYALLRRTARRWKRSSARSRSPAAARSCACRVTTPRWRSVPSACWGGKANVAVEGLSAADASGPQGATSGFTRNLGVDLRNDPTISFTYNDALATADGSCARWTRSNVTRPASARVIGIRGPDTGRCCRCSDRHGRCRAGANA